MRERENEDGFFLQPLAVRCRGAAQAVAGSRPRAARPQGLALTRSGFSTLSYAVQAEFSACTA
jgi:hypothetical protein